MGLLFETRGHGCADGCVGPEPARSPAGPCWSPAPRRASSGSGPRSRGAAASRAQRFGHVVNVVSWGVQLEAPKFAAYLASKTALDTWSRIAGCETYEDNLTFTNMRFGLVRTAMMVSSESYEDRCALSAEQAAARVVGALEERPVTVDLLAGRVGEPFNIVAPRLSDALMARHDQIAPDSRAARGEQQRG